MFNPSACQSAEPQLPLTSTQSKAFVSKCKGGKLFAADERLEEKPRRMKSIT